MLSPGMVAGSCGGDVLNVAASAGHDRGVEYTERAANEADEGPVCR
jgi:hypothetical protein